MHSRTPLVSVHNSSSLHIKVTRLHNTPGPHHFSFRWHVRHTWYRALWNLRANVCFRPNHPAGTPCNEHPRTPRFATTSASAILPGHILCGELETTPVSTTLALAVLLRHPLHGAPQEPPAYTPPWLQPPLQGTLYAESSGTPLFIPTSASVILPRCPLYIEPQDTLTCTHFSFSSPTRVPSVGRT